MYLSWLLVFAFGHFLDCLVWGRGLERGLRSEASFLWVGYAWKSKCYVCLSWLLVFAFGHFLYVLAWAGGLERGLGSKASFLWVGYAWKSKCYVCLSWLLVFAFSHFLYVYTWGGGLERDLVSEASFLWLGYAWKSKCQVYLSWLLVFAFGHFLDCLVHKEVWDEASDLRPLFVGWLYLKMKMLCMFELATCLCIWPFLGLSSADGGLRRRLGSEASFL